MSSHQPSELSTLLEDFLLNPLPSPPLIRPIHFAQTPLKDYSPYYAIVIDNILTLGECDQLLRAAEATRNGQWEEAMVNIGGGRQAMAKEVRHCSRIIWDSDTVTQRIWGRVRPYLEGPLSEDAVAFKDGFKESEPKTMMQYIAFEGKEDEKQEDVKCLVFDRGIATLESGAADVVGAWTGRKRQRRVCKGLNHRMRFLKYEDGHYFKPHIDGPFVVPGSKRMQKTIFTLHLYLNEAGPTNPFKGGATTFFSNLWYYWTDADKEENNSSKVGKMNVEPKTGRILVFQHDRLVHSGEDVAGGVKYTMRTDIMYQAEAGGEEVHGLE